MEAIIKRQWFIILVTLLISFAALAAFTVIRYYNKYDNTFLYHEDNSWQQ